jgi:hypothetical protein
VGPNFDPAASGAFPIVVFVLLVLWVVFAVNTVRGKARRYTTSREFIESAPETPGSPRYRRREQDLQKREKENQVGRQ